jgi:hypothetical protein
LPARAKRTPADNSVAESDSNERREHREQRSVDHNELIQAIHNAKTALVSMLKSDGQFVYRIDGRTGMETNPGYNIVRHSGSIYALAMYDQRYHDPAARDAIVRASRFLVRSCVKSVGDATDELQAVVFTPEMSEAKPRLEAELGGTALGVVALLRAREVDPEAVDSEVLKKLGHFLCYLQDNDGRFYTKYLIEKKSRSRNNPSLYYPGEAILALTQLFENTQDSQFLQAAVLGMRHLANSRSGSARVPADNWALIATAKLVSLGDRVDTSDKALFKEHAAQIANAEIARQIVNPAEESLYGCFNHAGLTTPTATRLEGILATLAYWPKEDVEYRARLKASADAGISFLLHAQIKEGPQKGAFPEVIEAAWDKPRERPSRTLPSEIRIDYIQHALSALLRYQEIEEQEYSK